MVWCWKTTPKDYTELELEVSSVLAGLRISKKVNESKKDQINKWYNGNSGNGKNCD